MVSVMNTTPMRNSSDSSFHQIKAFLMDVRIVVFIATSTAAIDIGWLLYSIADQYNRVARATMVIIDIDPSVSLMHIRIGVALLIAAVCLWFRRVVGLVISVAALIWVLIEYCLWFIWSANIQREAGITSGFGLYGANGWNVAVLVIALVLFAWVAKALLRLWVTTTIFDNE